ncbi:hypothetical protein LZ30DRAFT_754736 [Colletotrichum cereale]|nr:hypothetical protein LZ30DRAFT_754736 [Colletotrichum cereale]
MSLWPTVAPPDLTISSAIKSYIVYRAIVCPYSKLLAAARYLLGLFLHTKVYAITEKYVISSLKDLTDASDFLNTASKAYTSIINPNQGLQDVILKDKAKSLVKRQGLLTYNLLMYFHQKAKLQY